MTLSSRQAFVTLYLLALLTITLAIRYIGWEKTWSTLQVPPQQPSFIDMRTVQAGVAAVKQGLDPQRENPADRYGRVMDYPDIWLSLGELFHLEDEAAYQWFCLVLVGLYVMAGIWLLYHWPSPWMLAALLSPASLLAMERGNNDMLVFVLVILFSVAGSRLIALLPGLLAVLLKVYPVAIIGALLIRRDKRLLAWFVPLSLLVFLYLYDQLQHIRAGVTQGVKLSYGLPHWQYVFSKAGMDVWWFGVFVLATIVLIALVLRWCLRRDELRAGQDTTSYRLFLAGASIYVLTWLLASNWDYRLIFLNLCIPFLLQNGKNRKEFPLVLILLAMCFVPLYKFGAYAGLLLNFFAKYALFVFLSASLMALLWRGWMPVVSQRDQ